MYIIYHVALLITYGHLLSLLCMYHVELYCSSYLMATFSPYSV